jgi:filamentous hemagglutinin family protein
MAALRAWLLGGTALLAPSGLAFAQGPAPGTGPSGGQVVAGSAGITQTAGGGAGQTTISQSSQRAAIEWRQFNVGAQHHVQFVQPNAQAATLNRVVGPDPSVIAGRMTATTPQGGTGGLVAIVNQSGVVFAQGAQVNVGSLIASAANITNQNFMAGRMVFDGKAKPGASVENHGTITVADRGLAALVGPRVVNSGRINARLGKVALTGGAEAFSLDLAGDGLLSIDVTHAVQAAPAGGVALATNSGVIEAAGGAVLISAHAASGLVEDLVRHTGRISANTEAGQPGTVALRVNGGNLRVDGVVEARGTAPGHRGGRIEAQAVGGTVTVAAAARISASGEAGGGTVQIGGRSTRDSRVEGSVRARGRGADAKGGTVAVQASESVTVAAGATVDVSGRGGGGTALVGTTGVGRAQQMARRTTVERGAAVRADALQAGDGGAVAVNSAEQTEMRGALSARGGERAGNGGLIEISGMAAMTIDGQADIRAPAGTAGTVVIDPENIRVVAVLPVAVPPDANQDPPLPTQITAATADGGTLNVLNTDIDAFAGTLRLDALTNVTVDAPINMTEADSGLTIVAGATVALNASVAVTGDVTITGTTITASAAGTITAGTGATNVASLRGDTITLGATVTASAGLIELGPRTAGAAFSVTLPSATALVAPAIEFGRTGGGDRVLGSWTPSTPGALGSVTSTAAIAPPAITTPAGGTLSVFGGSIAVDNTLTAAGGAISLTASTGVITQTAALTTGALTASAAAAGQSVTLGLAGNAVASVAGAAGTSFTFAQDGSFAVAGITAGTAAGDTVTLNSNTGSITQTAAITGGDLTATAAAAGQSVTLDLAGNAVASVAGSAGTGGAFTFAQDGGFAVGAGGIVSPTAVTLTSNTGSITQSGTIVTAALTASAAGGAITLDLANTIATLTSATALGTITIRSDVADFLVLAASGDGVTLQNRTAPVAGVSAGTITLSGLVAGGASGVTLVADRVSVAVAPTGAQLTFSAVSADRPIQLGGADPGVDALFVPTALVDGFTGIVRLDGQTGVTVAAAVNMANPDSGLTIVAGAAVAVNDTVTVTGNVTITGTTITTAAPVPVTLPLGATITAGDVVSLRGDTITLDAIVTASAGLIELGPRNAGAPFSVTLPAVDSLVAPAIAFGQSAGGDRVVGSWTPSTPDALGTVTATTAITPPAITTPAGGTLSVFGGSIAVGNALIAAGGAINLTASTGGITQSVALTTGALTANAAAAGQSVALGGLANDVDSVAGSAGSSFAFRNDGVFVVAGITAGTAIGDTVTLTSDAGSITQSAAITGRDLTATAVALGQSVTLDAANSVVSVAGTAATSFGFRNVGDFAVAGITAGTAAGDTVTLTSDTGGITQGVAITGHTLIVTAETSVELGGLANDVAVVGGEAGQSFAFRNDGTFVVAGVIAGTAIGDLVVLTTDTGSITQSAAITGRDLTANAAAAGQSVTLDGLANEVVSVAGTAGAAFAFLNAGSLAVGGAGVSAPVAVTLTSNLGAVSVNAPVTSAGGTITLNAGGTGVAPGGINLAADVSAGAGTVVLRAAFDQAIGQSAGILTAAAVSAGGLAAGTEAGSIILAREGNLITTLTEARANGIVSVRSDVATFTVAQASGSDVTLTGGRVGGTTIAVTGLVSAIGDAALIANAIDLSGGFSPSVSADGVTLAPFDAIGVTVDGTVVGTLSLTTDTLDRVAATARLTLGSPTAGAIDIAAARSFGATALELLSGAAVTQRLAAAITVDELRVQAASASLPQANRIGTVAADVAGDFVLTNAQALEVGTVLGTAGIQAATADLLVAVGDLTQSAAGVINVSALRARATEAGASIRLDTAPNLIGTLAARADANVQVQNAQALTIGTVGGTAGIAGATVTAAGLVDLLVTAGDLTQSDVGVISATELRARATAVDASIRLDSAPNQIGTLAARADASVQVQNAQALTIGTVAGTAGIAAADGTSPVGLVDLLVTAGDLSQAADTDVIAANELRARATGAGASVRFDTAPNLIGTLAARADAIVLVQNAQALTIGTVALTAGIAAADGISPVGLVDLLVTAGDLLQAADTDVISATELRARATGLDASVRLGSAPNLIGTLAARADANVLVQNAQGLTIGTVLGTAGIAATNGTSLVGLTDLLVTAGDLTQSATGVIATTELRARATEAGASVRFDSAPNRIGTLSARADANVLMRNAQSLAIGNVLLTPGIAGATVAATGTVDLSLITGHLSQTGTGAIIASNLRARTGAGAVELADGDNSVGTLAGRASTDFTFRNTQTLGIGTVLGTSGVAVGVDALDVVGELGRTLTLIADDMAIGALLTAPAGTVILSADSAGRHIALGRVDVPGLAGNELSLTAAELQLVRAATLVIGGTGVRLPSSVRQYAADIDFRVNRSDAGLADAVLGSSLALQGSPANLVLSATGAIQQRGRAGGVAAEDEGNGPDNAAGARGWLRVDRLSLAAGSFAWLGADNRIGALGDVTVGASGVPGNFVLRQAPLLTAGALDSGRTGNGVLVEGAVRNIGAPGGGIVIAADALDIGPLGSLAAPGGVVDILPATAGRPVILGADESQVPLLSADALAISAQALARIGDIAAPVGVLRIGRSADAAVAGNPAWPVNFALGVSELAPFSPGPRTAGNVTLAGDVELRDGGDLNRVGRLELFAGVEGIVLGGINQTAGRLNVADLTGESLGATALGGATNRVDRLVRRTEPGGVRASTTAFLTGAGTVAPADAGFALTTTRDLIVLGDVLTAGIVAPLAITTSLSLTLGEGTPSAGATPGVASNAVLLRAGIAGTDAARLIAGQDIRNFGLVLGTGRNPAGVLTSAVQSTGGSVFNDTPDSRMILGFGAPGGAGPGVAAGQDIVTFGEMNAFAANAGGNIIVRPTGSLTVATDALAGTSILIDSALQADGNAVGGLRAGRLIEAPTIDGIGGLVASNVTGLNSITDALVAFSVAAEANLSIGNRLVARDVTVGGALTVAPGTIIEAINSLTAGSVAVEGATSELREGRITTGMLTTNAGGIDNAGTIVGSAIVAAGEVTNTGRIAGAVIQSAGAGVGVNAFPATPPDNLVQISTTRWDFNIIGQTLEITSQLPGPGGGGISNLVGGVITTTLGDAALPPDYGNFGYAQITAPPTLVDSPLALLAMGGAIINAAGAAITSTGSIAITAGDGLVTSGTILSQGLAAGTSGDITLHAIAGDIVQNGGSIATPGAGVTLRLVADTGDIVQNGGSITALGPNATVRFEALVGNVRQSGGGVFATRRLFAAGGGEVDLDGQNEFSELLGATFGLGGGVIQGQDFSVVGDVLSVGSLTLQASQSLAIGAPGAGVSIRSTAGGVTMTAETGSLALFGSEVAALGGGALLTAQGGITLSESRVNAAGNLGVTTSGGGIRVEASDLVAQGNLRAEAGNAIAWTGSSASAGRNLTQVGGGAIAIVGSPQSPLARLMAQGDMRLDAGTGLSIGAATLTAGGDLVARAAGSIAATDTRLTSNTITLNTDGGLALTSSAATAAGALTLRAARAIGITGTQLTAGGTATLNAGGGLSLVRSDAVASGDLTLRAEEAITLTASRLATQSALTLASQAGLLLSDIRLGAVGALTLGSTTGMTLSGLQANAGGALSASTPGALTLSDGSLGSSGGAVTLFAGSGATISNSTLSAATTLTIRDAPGVSISNTSLSADQAWIEGPTVALDGITAIIGTTLLLQAPGGITETGTTVVRPRTEGQLPAVVYDTRPAAPQTAGELLAIFRPDLPGLAPEQQPTQLRSAPGAESPNARLGLPPGTPTGPISLRVDAGQSPVFLLIDGGTVTGTINAGRLGIHGTAGSLSLSGTLNGLSGAEAARAGDITRPIDPATLQNYRMNGCVIGAVNCIITTRFQPVPPTVRTIVDFNFRPGLPNPTEVTIPNTGENDYE